tara:strand:+ start:15424 stop:15837 length:414 start_codon:yes stop_codon:yes gene_type:complete
MGLISGTAHKVQVPHERSEADGGPHWIEIRKLSGAEMDEASHSQTTKVLERMGDMMGTLQGSAPTSTNEEKNSLAVRRMVYDPEILIHYALLSWSYREEVQENPGAQLDSITRDWLWEIIVDENTYPPVPSPYGGQS